MSDIEVLKSEAKLSETQKRKPKIDDFEMKEIIGIGNFGRVIKALNKIDNKFRALKIVSKESVAYMK
jgi:serine/threonine protein kinase